MTRESLRAAGMGTVGLGMRALLCPVPFVPWPKAGSVCVPVLAVRGRT